MGILGILLNGKRIKELIGFLLKFWKPIVFLAVVGVIVYQNTSTWQFLFGLDTIPKLHQELSESDKKIKKLKQANKTLSNTIERRNAEVQKWKTITEQSEDEIATLEDEIAIIDKKTNNTVDQTLNSPTPKTCKDAFEYLREGIEELTWE